MEDYLCVPNWEELQHYKDRCPPWIKLHSAIMESYEFENLPDASKAHLICIWLLASRTKNKINSDAKWIARKIGANSKVDIDLLIQSGFLERVPGTRGVPSMEQDASNTLAEGKQDAIERESRERGEESREEYISFDDFWHIYEKRVNEKGVRTYWKKLKVDHELFSKIKTHISLQYRTTERKFWPKAMDYLKQEKWNDDIVDYNDSKPNGFDTEIPSFERRCENTFDAFSGNTFDGELN